MSESDLSSMSDGAVRLALQTTRAAIRRTEYVSKLLPEDRASPEADSPYAHSLSATGDLRELESDLLDEARERGLRPVDASLFDFGEAESPD